MICYPPSADHVVNALTDVMIGVNVRGWFSIGTGMKQVRLNWYEASDREAYLRTHIHLIDEDYAWFDQAVLRLVDAELVRVEEMWQTLHNLLRMLDAGRVILPNQKKLVACPVTNFLVAAERNGIWFSDMHEVEKIGKFLAGFLRPDANGMITEERLPTSQALLNLCTLFGRHLPCLESDDARLVTTANVFIGAVKAFALFNGAAEPCQCLRVSARWPWVDKDAHAIPLMGLFGAERLDDLAELLSRGRIDRTVAASLLAEPRILALRPTFAELDRLLFEYGLARRPTKLLWFIEWGGTKESYFAEKARRKEDTRRKTRPQTASGIPTAEPDETPGKEKTPGVPGKS